MQRVDADVTAHRQAFGLSPAHQFNAGGAADAAQVHAGAGAADQLKNRVQGNRLGGYRHAGQAHARGQRPAGGNAATQIHILRPQPDGVAKAGGVLQGALQHLGVGQRHLGLTKSHTTGLKQLHHLGQHFSGQTARQRPDWKHPRAMQLAGTKPQHVNQARFIQHRVGIGQAGQAGNASGDCSR